MDKEICKKAAILGSSIAGSSLALLLNKAGVKVKVFEQKSRAEIGNKVCANVVTSSFLTLVEKLGINPKKVINKKFCTAEFYSKNNFVKFPVKDYEIDRKKLLSEIVKRAENAGAEFHFRTKFLDMEKIDRGYNLLLQKSNGKRSIECFDYVIGADGALSKVAKKSGLWQKRKFWLAIQTKIPAIKRKIKKGSYEIFFIEKFSYYSYIFPSRNHIVIGVVANPENAKEKFNHFLNFLKIKVHKRESALIPLPKKIKFRKGNIFLTGDAACQTKFTGGGIVPALESAFALKDIIINKKNKKANELGKETFFHQLITKVLCRINDDDFDKLFEIAKKSNIKMAASRDELRNWVASFVLRNPYLFRFLPKLF